jgi:hypothetical protein
MSSPLAIAAVTGVLQYLINLVCNDPSTGFGSVNVTAIAPDLILNAPSGNGEVQRQLNLFMHQVTPNAAWRNVGLPSLGPDGATRLKNPPLALDLHYLLTAYANADTEAEALLGYSILFLHDYPILSRSDINTALGKIPTSNPLYNILSSSDLGSQFEMIKISPATLGREEMAWLWTALKADYRPTFPFQVSVVLIQTPQPASSALPVITRVITVQPSLPQAMMITPPSGITAGPGDSVTITGVALSTVNNLLLQYPQQGVKYGPFAPTGVTDTSITFTIPEAPATVPAGPYSLTAIVTDGSGNIVQSSNSVTMPIAAKILFTPTPPAVTNSAAETTVTLECDPDIQPSQSVSLLLGGSSTPAESFTAATSSLTFVFKPGLATGSYVARLQVDGVVGPVTLSVPPAPPAITGPSVNVP